MGGNALQISYSPGGENQGAGANTDGKMWAVTLQGQWGRLGAGYDWTKLTGNTPAVGSQASSTGHKLRAGWTYQPGGQISLLWVKSVQDNGGFTAISTNNVAVANALGLVPDITATSLSQTSWGLSWEHMFGNVQALAQWGKVNNITGCAVAGRCDNTNATTWMLGCALHLLQAHGNVRELRHDPKRQQLQHGLHRRLDDFGEHNPAAGAGRHEYRAWPGSGECRRRSAVVRRWHHSQFLISASPHRVRDKRAPQGARFLL